MVMGRDIDSEVENFTATRIVADIKFITCRSQVIIISTMYN